MGIDKKNENEKVIFFDDQGHSNLQDN